MTKSMTKILTAIAITAFAIATMFTSTAQAGFKGRLAVGLAIGALGVMAHQAHRYEERKRWHKRRYVRRHQEKTYVSKKKSTPKKAEVAKVEKPAETPPLPVAKVSDAENENSSITTAAIDPVDSTAPIATGSTDATTEATVEPVAETTSDTPKTATKLDCKKFFPSVGMTLTVPCE